MTNIEQYVKIKNILGVYLSLKGEQYKGINSNIYTEIRYKSYGGVLMTDLPWGLF